MGLGAEALKHREKTKLCSFSVTNLSPVHISNNVKATLSNATKRTILSTKLNVASILLLFLATISNDISPF